MSERARELAEQLEDVNREVIATVESASADGWHAYCAAEQRTVAALTCHIAGTYPAIVANLLRPIAAGGEVRAFTMADIDRSNAEAAQANARRPKAEALQMLRDNGTRAVAYVRGLTDDQLNRSAAIPVFGGATMTAAAVIENVLISHARGHLGSIRAAIA